MGRNLIIIILSLFLAGVLSENGYILALAIASANVIGWIVMLYKRDIKW